MAQEFAQLRAENNKLQQQNVEWASRLVFTGARCAAVLVLRQLMRRLQDHHRMYFNQNCMQALQSVSRAHLGFFFATIPF